MSVLTVEDIIARIAPVQVMIPECKPKPPAEKMYELPPVMTTWLPSDLYKFTKLDGGFDSGVLYLLDDLYCKSLNPEEFRNYIKMVRQKMSSDIDEKSLFKQFNYQKDKKMKKGPLQTILLGDDLLSDAASQKFFVDYFSINIIIFKIGEDESLIDITAILSSDDSLESNPFKPTILLLSYNKNEEDVYYPIVMIQEVSSNSKNILLFPNSEVLSKILTALNNKSTVETETGEKHPLADGAEETQAAVVSNINLKGKLKKTMTLKELQALALANGINIKKPSEKSTNMIGKTKNELWMELTALSSQ